MTTTAIAHPSSPPAKTSTSQGGTALRSLLRALRFSQGEFSLILAAYSDERQRRNLTRQILEFSPAHWREVTLPASATTLLSSLSAALESQSKPDAVMVSGLERVADLAAVLGAANFARNELRRQYPFPLVLWVTPEILRQLKRLAPDLSNWAAPPICFA